MDYLREGVHLRAMAQPTRSSSTLEGHAMFEELNAAIREEVVFTLFHAELAPEDAELLAMQDGHGNGAALEYEHQSLAAPAIAAAGWPEASWRIDPTPVRRWLRSRPAR
jgi:preprotein translocase subunit SecA